MKILAIESSAVTASVAIVTDDAVVAQYTINYKKTHSQTLLPMIDEICKMTQTDIGSVDYIAVSAGPGSFTGLRIGAATGKGIALATNAMMVEVPTLEALAYNVSLCGRHVCCIMDAKRSHLYCAVYRFDDKGLIRTVIKQSLLSFEELAEKINELGESVVFVGDGIDVAKCTLQEKVKVDIVFAGIQNKNQNAVSVGMAACRMISEGRIVNSDDLKPDYLRPSQAERELNDKLSK